jgi:hypothetical protein
MSWRIERTCPTPASRRSSNPLPALPWSPHALRHVGPRTATVPPSLLLPLHCCTTCTSTFEIYEARGNPSLSQPSPMSPSTSDLKEEAAWQGPTSQRGKGAPILKLDHLASPHRSQLAGYAGRDDGMIGGCQFLHFHPILGYPVAPYVPTLPSGSLTLTRDRAATFERPCYRGEVCQPGTGGNVYVRGNVKGSIFRLSANHTRTMNFIVPAMALRSMKQFEGVVPVLVDIR